MENENANEEPLIKENEKPVEKDTEEKDTKKDKRMSVLKQLDNKKLYPVQERVGIYIIAALSAIGLVLIGYTGVMALTSNAPLATEALVIEEDVLELLDEIDLEDDPIEDDEDMESENEVDSEPEDEEPEDEVAPNEEDEDEDDDDDSSTPTTATVNQNLIGLRRELATGDIIEYLNEGDVVEIIDIESNQYWAQVVYDSSEFGRLEGFISQEFLDY